MRVTSYMKGNLARHLAIFGLSLGLMAQSPVSFAQVVNDSMIGDNNMQADNTGVAVNGDANGSNINSNQNNLSTGNNNNVNTVGPTVVAPSQQYSGVQGGSGGASALVLPRNPLALPNAALGRSNFGLQFGVQNNPGLSAITGEDNALGWFMQGGVTIPFGKIPDVLSSPKNVRLDDLRQKELERERMVFAEVRPRAEKKIEGKVVGLNAYNYSTVPSPRLQASDLQAEPAFSPQIIQPRVLALEPAEVFSRPLNTGKKVAVAEVGHEYPYLGHTSSGWVKILLPNGTTGWTNSRLEYIKSDFTEIDGLAERAPQDRKTAGQPSTRKVAGVPERRLRR